MKITLEKHAYTLIEVDPNQLSPELRQQLENVTHDDDYEDLFEQIIQEHDDFYDDNDFEVYETVVQLENEKDLIWETIGV